MIELVRDGKSVKLTKDHAENLLNGKINAKLEPKWEINPDSGWTFKDGKIVKKEKKKKKED